MLHHHNYDQMASYSQDLPSLFIIRTPKNPVAVYRIFRHTSYPIVSPLNTLKNHHEASIILIFPLDPGYTHLKYSKMGQFEETLLCGAHIHSKVGTITWARSPTIPRGLTDI
jgi:hypothetical protein